MLRRKLVRGGAQRQLTVSEPTTGAQAGLLALAIALFGPLAGQYAVIVMASLAGSLWALSEAQTRGAGSAALVLRLVLTAVVLAGSATWWLESRYDLPSHQILSPVAFLIGAFGNRWRAAIKSLWDAAAKRLGAQDGRS